MRFFFRFIRFDGLFVDLFSFFFLYVGYSFLFCCLRLINVVDVFLGIVCIGVFQMKFCMYDFDVMFVQLDDVFF